jgi:hypothetical protein
MRTVVTDLLIVLLIFQIGCSSITQIPLPIETSKSENEVRQLNYFGEKLNSTIKLTSQVEVEAYWLKMKDDKIYFLTSGLDDTCSVGVDKINTIRFYDGYGGCMKGAWLGLGLTLLEGFLLWGFSSGSSGHPEAGVAILIVGPVSIILGTLYGIFFLGEREFNYVQNKSVRE